MDKSSKHSRPMPATDRSSVSASFCSTNMEQTFCVVLHVVEAINFNSREVREGEREQIIMNAALNTVDFEVEGSPSSTAETIIFNSNCIWECDMAGIKRIKTDHRPVKVIFYTCSNSERKVIGSLLLPIRGLPVLGMGGNNSPLQLKMFWHKLTCISNVFRSQKPEVLLMLAIIKKSLLHTKEFKHLTALNRSEKQSRTPPLQSPGHSITANMLQSQANVYVQSLLQLGLLQVGNDPLVDCDIIEVILQFKHLKNLNNFVKTLNQGKGNVDTVMLMFDFVGNVTNINLKLNTADSYTLNDVLGLRFKSSLRSIRLYFQRIFYLPINMYLNGTSIANYRMDFGKLLPPDSYFAGNRKFVHSGSFLFDRFSRMGSARELKPIMEYTFTVEIQEVYWRQKEKNSEPQLKHPQHVHEDHVDIKSAGSKAVILEVPNDLSHDNVVDWNLISEKKSSSVNGSAGSLNVGAELSASDDEVVPQVSDASRCVPTTVHSFQKRRRKFTRLYVDQSKPQEETEYTHETQHQCSTKVVTKKISTKLQLEEDPLPVDYVADLLDDMGSVNDIYAYGNSKEEKTKDWCPERIYETKEVKKHFGSVASGFEKELSGSGRDVMCSQGSQQMDEMSSKFLRDEFQLSAYTTKQNEEKSTINYKDTNAIDRSMLDEREKKCPRWNVKFKAENESTGQSEVRTGAPEMLKVPAPNNTVESHDLNSNGSNSRGSIRSRKNIKASMGNELAINPKISQSPSSQIDELAIKAKVLQKKTIAKTDTLEFSNISNEELISDDKSNKLETNGLEEFVKEQKVTNQKLKISSQIKKCKAGLQKKKMVKTESIEISDSFNQEQVGDDSINDFVGQLEADELKSTSKIETPTLKKENTMEKSKAEVCLSARWVEVCKEQSKVLGETEQFIAKNCKIDLDGISMEDQSIEKPARKSVRSARRTQKKNLKYFDPTELDNFLMEEFLKLPGEKHRPLKNKCDIQPDQDLTEVETSVETSVTDLEKPASKVLKKKHLVEPQLDQSISKHTNRTKEPVEQKLDSSTSEVESCVRRKLERKDKRRSINSSLNGYLDTEEAFVVDRSVNVLDKPREGDTSVKDPLKKEPAEPETMQRKKLVSNRTAKELHKNLLKKICTMKEETELEAGHVADNAVSRLEVIVHMYDASKAATDETARSSARYSNQTVQADINNMDESIKRIIEAGKQLQNEIQRKTQDQSDNLNQRGSGHMPQSSGSPKQTSCQELRNTSLDYESKISELEQHISMLEKHLRRFESRTQEIQLINTKLAAEKDELLQRITQMEKQIAQLGQQGNGKDFQQVLNKMNAQNMRYMEMSVAKERYKKQWRRSAKRVHALKLAIYEKKVDMERMKPATTLDLKSILTQDAKEFEHEYGRFRKSKENLSFCGSSESSEPLLKEYLRGLSSQSVYQPLDSSRMH